MHIRYPTPKIMISLTLMMLVAMVSTPTSLAQKSDSGKASDRDTKASVGTKQVDDEPEVKAAMAFVKEHHSEIVSLLELLKAMNPKQFDTAIKDTNRVRVKLEQLRTKDTAAYEMELESWKVQSQINLHVAKRVAVDHDFASDKDLKLLLDKQRRLQVKVLESEKTRIQKRLSQIDEQLGEANDRSEEWLTIQIGKLARKAATQGPKIKKK